MIVLCPSCWRTVEVGASACPHCGADMEAMDQRTYADKLIAALQHPDAQTVARASVILAKTEPAQALVPLSAALRRFWREPYLAAAMVEALSLLDGVEARALVTDALGHHSLIVRAAAAKALQHARTDSRAHPKR